MSLTNDDGVWFSRTILLIYRERERERERIALWNLFIFHRLSLKIGLRGKKKINMSNNISTSSNIRVLKFEDVKC